MRAVSASEDETSLSTYVSTTRISRTQLSPPYTPLNPPMSSAISRTRTVAQCVTFGASRCRRFNSTEAFSASSNAAASAPILTTTAEQRTHAKSSPSEQLHRALYPSFYQNDGRMINQKWKLVRQKSVKAKGIKPQWRATMKKKDVVHGLSTEATL